MLEDQYGNTLSTSSNAARDGYVDAVEAILSAAQDPAAGLQASLNADPNFALAHAAMARHLMLLGDIKNARQSITQAQGLAKNLTPREQQHIEIFHLLLTGRSKDALTFTRKHIQEHPRDAFALAPSTSVFGLIGFGGNIGREDEQVELLAPLRDAYGDDWWFQTVYAFALIESGQWQQGRDLAQQALEVKPRSAHTAHIYAHALYEGGEDQALVLLVEQVQGEHRHVLHLARGDDLVDGRLRPGRLAARELCSGP